MRTDAKQDEIFAAVSEIERPDWLSFARHCEYRRKGLRIKASAELSQFMADAATWPFDARLEFVLWVLQWERDPSNNPLLSQPLWAKCLVPTVREWNARDPQDAASHLWLGLLRQDNPSAHLERAIAIDPDCEHARMMLSQWICGDVHYNQHELPALYIHDPRGDLRALDRVFELCEPFTTRPWALFWCREATQQKLKAEAWLRDHPRPGDFANH